MRDNWFTFAPYVVSVCSPPSFGEGEYGWKIAVSNSLRIVLDPIVLRLSRSNIRYISPKIRPSSLRGLRVIEQVRNEFAPALEPFMVHFDTERLLLGFWIVAYEAFFSPHLSRSEKEEIAVRISRANRCDYCARAHEQIAWAAAGCVPAVAPTQAPERLAEGIAIERVFEYINRMMLVFTYGPNPFLRRNFLMPFTGAIANLRIGPEARRIHEQGLSLQLIEDSDPKPLEDTDNLFTWADTIPIVKRAFQQWHALMLETERGVEVSLEVKAHLRNLSLQRSTAAILAESEGELVRFAEQLILVPEHLELPEPKGALRKRFPTDAAWVNFVAWCSYLATLR
jgi:AhpD family alkylhydroperoxidase